MATVMGDVSSEARYEYRGLRGFVNLGDEVGMCSHDRGSMELAMEVMTAERGCSQAKARGQVRLQALPFQQFHVLFDSLSKVLFIFRSLYLCAIGLWPVFSFRRNLPPA